MNIKNQKSFIESLNKIMAENGDNGIEFFKQSWPLLDNDDRKALTSIIQFGAGQMIGQGRPLEVQLSWLAIANYADKPIEDGKIVEEYSDDLFPGLVLRKGVNGNQITKIFRDLKQKGVIDSSYELIAEYAE